jgi:ribosome-associated protein
LNNLAGGMMEPMREVTTRDDVIRLGQFLKLADVVAAGSDAKVLLAEGAVSVNGETELRRGRQLVKGDVVVVGGHQLRVG